MTLIVLSTEDTLSKSEVGQAVLALGLENCSDHRKHRGRFIGAMSDLGGTPVAPDQPFDLTSYLAMSTVT